MSQQNFDSSQVLPGFFGHVDFNSQAGGVQPNNKVLLINFIGATAQFTPNQPFRPASQQEADDGCERGSDLANDYAAAVAQPESQGADIWLLPIVPPSGGTAGTYKLTVFVASTNPGKSGTLALTIMGQPVPQVGFTTTDTASTIASALATAIAGVKDLPIASAAAVGAVVTITYKHKGTNSEDFPVRCNISPAATGVNLSPGQALFAVNAVGAGSAKISLGALSVSTAIAGADTPSAIATKVAASWNADTYPLVAVVDSTPQQVDFFFANDRDVRRMSAAIITSTGTTVNLGSGATDGTGSASSLSLNGTAGVGAPSLAAALTNLLATNGYRSWEMPWTDATTLGTVATQLLTESDGSITGQKQQTLTIADFESLATAGAIATTSSPDLTQADPRFTVLWSPEAAVKASHLAAKIASARASKWIDTPQFNWNGFKLKGNTRAPLPLQPVGTGRPSKTSLNTALRTYALAPVVPGPSGFLEVVKGRTTSLAQDKRLWAWSSEAQAAFHVVDLAGYYQSLFQGGSIMRFGEPKAPNIFDVKSVEKATQARMRKWERDGSFDGADALAAAVKVTVSGLNIFAFAVKFPESPVIDLDQIVFEGQFTSPAQ